MGARTFYLADRLDNDCVAKDLERPFHSNPSISVRMLCDALHDADVDVYVMGGAVRDWILGTSARDIDLTVSTSVDHALKCLSGFASHITVKRKALFGLAYLLGDSGDVDINSMRTCDDIADNPDIDEVHFHPRGDLRSDAACRDFTFNAMYYKVSDGTVTSFYENALNDIETRTLRLIMDPRKLKIDYRVTIRILQFMARGYSPTYETLNILKERLEADILKYPRYRDWMLFHVPKDSQDFSSYIAVTREYLPAGPARQLFESWIV